MRLERGSGDLRWRKFYDRLAPVYDLSIGLWALLLGYSDTQGRQKMVRRLKLEPGDRVLEVSVGTASNLGLMAPIVGKSEGLVGLDISPGMLRQCRVKMRRSRVRASLIAVLHFGGINEFSDQGGRGTRDDTGGAAGRGLLPD